METIFAKDFEVREQIEKYIIGKYGATAELKDAMIEGTIEDLKKLHLSNTSSVWGVKCRTTNQSTSPPVVKLNRGKIYQSKIINININNSKEL